MGGLRPGGSDVPAGDGLVDKTIVSQVFLDGGDGSLAKAFVSGSAKPAQLFGVAEAEMQMSDGVLGGAEVHYLVNFTVASTTQLSGTVGFKFFGCGHLLAGVLLQEATGGNAVLLSTNASAPDIDVLLTLEPGTYSLLAQTSATNINTGDGFGAIVFAYNLLATDVVDPPAAVPEPVSLALALAGLLTTAASRRRRKLD